MRLRKIAVTIVAVGLLIGLWAWQVDNVSNRLAEGEARSQASSGQLISWSSQQAPVADRAMGMAFAFLLCGVGCFTYFVAMQTELGDGPQPKDE